MTRPSKGRERQFDAFDLARKGGVLEGEVDAATLPRIADRLTSRPVPVRWRIRGASDAVGRAALVMELEGSVPMQCQRCLETIEQHVDQQTELVLAANEAELARLDEEVAAEVVLADQPLDALTLVEDELLLGLPYIARHPDDGCKLVQ